MKPKHYKLIIRQIRERNKMSEGNVIFQKVDDYYTPKEIVDMFGTFDYDPFTTKENAVRLNIPNYDTIETDGFKRDWSQFKRIWINPPFSKKKLVVDKIAQYVGGGTEIYMLTTMESLTNSYMTKLEPFDIYIPNGRISFVTADFQQTKSPAFGSCIIKINGSGKWFRIDKHGSTPKNL